jgi:hypothetical protein
VWLGALVAFVVLGIFNGIMMARRMAKAWPAAVDLSPRRVAMAQPAEVVGSKMRGSRPLPSSMSALRAARVQARRWQWLVWLGGAAMLVLAVIDSLFATPGRRCVVGIVFLRR